MNIEWNEVRWYSKLLALVLFIGLPFVGFWLGIKYQELRGPLSILVSGPVDTVATPTTSSLGLIAEKRSSSTTNLVAQKIETVPANRDFTILDFQNVTFTIDSVHKATGGQPVAKSTEVWVRK